MSEGQPPDPYTILKAAHQEILDELKGLITPLTERAPERPFEQVMKGVLGLVKRLTHHLRLEEQHLYTLLRSRLPEGAYLSDEMLKEHKAIFKQLRGLRTLVRRPGRVPGKGELKQRLLALEQFLTHHFAKEEQVVLWTAEVRLNREAWIYLSKRLSRKRRPNTYLNAEAESRAAESCG